MKRPSLFMILPPVVFVALAALFYFGMMRDDPDALPSAREGGPAPAVELAQLGPEPPFTDATLRDGEVKLVKFWASWCGPCRAEHPMLQAIADDGIPVYGINYKDNADNAMAFLEELGNPFAAIGADSTGRLGLDWGLYGVPETYVVAGDGTIMLRFAGPITRSVMENRIEPAIEEARAAGS